MKFSPWTRFHDVRLRLEGHAAGSRTRAFRWEFFLFGFKQAWACLFAALLLTMVLLTKLFWPQHACLARYDFLFLAALLVQVLLLWLRMETLREAKVILLFHVVGTLMEFFKTSMGSWAYPEASIFAWGMCRCSRGSCMRRWGVIWRGLRGFLGGPTRS